MNSGRLPVEILTDNSEGTAEEHMEKPLRKIQDESSVEMQEGTSTVFKKEFSGRFSSRSYGKSFGKTFWKNFC